MCPMRPDDPPLPSASPLSANVAHVRSLLSEAACGPEPTRALIVDLLVSLIEAGYLNSATWILAPSPLDDLDEIVFFLRSSADDETSPQDWRGGAELVKVIAEARDLTARTETVEVWSGNGPGIRRLVLVGYDGAPLTYLMPEVANFDGEESLVHSAVTDWRDHASDEAVLEARAPFSTATAVPEPSTRPDAPPDAETPSIPAVGPTMVSDAETFARAVQEALSHLSVEVELGSIEELVVASVRTALAEGPPPAAAPAVLSPPAPGEDHPAVLHPVHLAELAQELHQSLDDAVHNAVAAALPRAVDESLTRLLPELVDRAITASSLALSPDTVDDPVIEYARRNMQPLADESEQHPSAPGNGGSESTRLPSSQGGEDETTTLRVLRSDEIL
jgi:hypothetical protein